MQGIADEKQIEQILRSTSKLEHLDYTGIFDTFHATL